MFPRITYNICMRSSYTQRNTRESIRSPRGTNGYSDPDGPLSTTVENPYMKDPINDPLTHTGNEMLSGMSTKPSAVTDKDMKKFLKAGGKVQIITSKKYRSLLRTKSHMMGGVGSRYLGGGTRNQSGRSRRAS